MPNMAIVGGGENVGTSGTPSGLAAKAFGLGESKNGLTQFGSTLSAGLDSLNEFRPLQSVSAGEGRGSKSLLPKHIGMSPPLAIGPERPPKRSIGGIGTSTGTTRAVLTKPGSTLAPVSSTNNIPITGANGGGPLLDNFDMVGSSFATGISSLPISCNDADSSQMRAPHLGVSGITQIVASDTQTGAAFAVQEAPGARRDVAQLALFPSVIAGEGDSAAEFIVNSFVNGKDRVEEVPTSGLRPNVSNRTTIALTGKSADPNLVDPSDPIGMGQSDDFLAGEANPELIVSLGERIQNPVAVKNSTSVDKVTSPASANFKESQTNLLTHTTTSTIPALFSNSSPHALRDYEAAVPFIISDGSYKSASARTTLNGTSFASAGELFTRIDSSTAGPASWRPSGIPSMTVGVDDPTHGWLEIKAEGGFGHVSASLGAASEAVHSVLHAQLSGMAEYLAENAIAIRSLTVSENASGHTTQGGEPQNLESDQGSNSGGQNDSSNLESSVGSRKSISGEGLVGTGAPSSRIAFDVPGTEFPNASSYLVNVHA